MVQLSAQRVRRELSVSYPRQEIALVQGTLPMKPTFYNVVHIAPIEGRQASE
jgi:hypothetical protein